MKKSISMVLALFLFLSVSSNLTFASADVPGGGGDGEAPGAERRLTVDEQLREIENDDNLTDVQKAEARAKAELMKQVARLENNTALTKSQASAQMQKLFDDFNEKLSLSNPVMGTMAYGYLSVPYCKQETNYYCGPATTRQTLGYYNGLANTKSQSQIAQTLGVTSTSDGVPNAKSMRDYINANQKSVAYLEVTNPSLAAMQSWLDGAQLRRCPIILRMAATKNLTTDKIIGDWDYPTGGHYLNVSGQASAVVFQVTDPYIEWKKSDPIYTTGKYLVTTSQIHSVTIEHFAKSFWH